MRHAREDYDRIQDPAGKIPKDEPVMLFRGQDPFAPLVLDEYAALLHKNARSDADHATARLVERQAWKMREWQTTHAAKQFPTVDGVND